MRRDARQSTDVTSVDVAVQPPRQSSRFSCGECRQEFGDRIPSNCPECGVALDPANPLSVRDIEGRVERWLRRRELAIEFVTGFVTGLAVCAPLGFLWWFGLIAYNMSRPNLNLLIMQVCLGCVPAVLLARTKHVWNSIGYAIGTWSFFVWASLALAVDQMWHGVSLTRVLDNAVFNLPMGVLYVVIPTSVGLAIGGLVRVVGRRMR